MKPNKTNMATMKITSTAANLAARLGFEVMKDGKKVMKWFISRTRSITAMIKRK